MREREGKPHQNREQKPCMGFWQGDNSALNQLLEALFKHASGEDG